VSSVENCASSPQEMFRRTAKAYVQMSMLFKHAALHGKQRWIA
jgi:hypothetical protein